MVRRKNGARQADALRVGVLKQFRVIFGSVRQHFREVERLSGVTGSQLWILHEVQNQQGIGISELAERLSIHQSTCSQLIEKLVRAGCVRKPRGRSDQRRVELVLTRKGKRAVSRAPGPAEGVLPEALRELSLTELRKLGQGLDRVIEGLDLKDERAGERPLSEL